ncbi:MAG: D-lyxose/D-mannose family sugar isomerase [Treponema sp.]|jgi:D-lyxose ketol-isomerase|nr:D-lyxose/D-mannose family sugar isomerase [Treponema sp.]
MKRSEINAAIRCAERMLDSICFRLPEIAEWSPEQWKVRHGETGFIRQTMLGWDVTDFGTGNFPGVGGTLFTLRNGVPGRPDIGSPYAEKLICLQPGQCLPRHYHAAKTEDIITRSGLMWMELYNSRGDGSVDPDTPVQADCDGIRKTYAPGERFEVPPGSSVTLRPYLYHSFGASVDTVIGEVSSVNDDKADNFFSEPVGRFTEIEEDEEPYRLLCNEYGRF